MNVNKNLIKTPEGLFDVESHILYVTQQDYNRLSEAEKNSGNYVITNVKDPTTARVINDINDNIINIKNNYASNSDVTSINNKINNINNTISTDINNALKSKVDKVDGKGLSTNDYTTNEKNKLSGIQAGAQVNVQSDWNATSGDAKILNKPTSLPASDVYSWAKASSKPSYNYSEVGAAAANHSHDYLPLSGGTMNGHINFNEHSLYQFDNTPSYLVGIESFTDGGTLKWQSTSNIKVGSAGYADTAGSASANDVYAWAKQPNKPSYTPSEIGLGNVNNTSDADKPISTATQTALNTLSSSISNHTNNTNNPHGVTKAQVGLGSVGNFKAVSTVASQGLSSTEQANARANINASDTNHTHTKSQITDFPSSMPASDVYSWAKASSKPSYSWNEINSRPTKLSDFTNDVGFSTTTGTVTGVKVGSTSYSPSSGVVSLPAYPTSLPASDVYAWAKASSKPSYIYSEVGAAAADHTHSNYLTGITKAMVTDALGYTPYSNKGGTVSGSINCTATITAVNFLSENKGVYINNNTLQLGNDNNLGGILDIYKNSYKNRLVANTSLTSAATIYLPDKSGTLTLTSSDIRLKENIKDTTVNGLETINKIKIRQFDWNNNEENGNDRNTHQDIGFIADELEELDSRLAVGGGENEDGEMNIKSVDTFYLMGYVVKAMQELDSKIELLKSENESLKNELLNKK